MVLLKNSNNTLPIKSTQTRIAVIGARVNYSVQSTSSQDTCTSGAGGVLNCSLDFATNVRTGDLGSSRVFSDPAKAQGPVRRDHGRRRRARRDGDDVQQRQRRRRRRLRRRDRGPHAAGRGRGVHGLRRSHQRHHHLARGLARPRPEAEQRRPERPHHQRRGHGQAVRRGARGRQRHRHERLVRDGARGGDGVVPGDGRRHRARPPAVRRRRAERQAPDHLGREPHALADVRRQLRHDGDGLLPGLPLLRQDGHRAEPGVGQLPVRLRPLLHDLQLQRASTCRARRWRRTASSTSP